MAKFEHRNGSGTLFPNDYKEASNHPDYKGELKTPEGKVYEVAGWVKQGQKGDFISLNIQEPYVKKESGNDIPDNNNFPF